MSDVFFARAVLIQEVEGKCVRYSTDNESAIIVTKSEDLNIVMPASENGPSIYLDVPLNAVNHVAVATLDEPSQLSPVIEQTVVALSIQMSSISECWCYLNATRCHFKSIEIAFDNLDAATRVKSTLAANRSSAHEEQQLSKSIIPIDVSQVEEDEMSNFPWPIDNLQALEYLRDAVLNPDDLINHSQPEGTLVNQAVDGINVSQAHAVSTSQSSSTNADQEPIEDLIATATQANAIVLKKQSAEEPQPMALDIPSTQQSMSINVKESIEAKVDEALSVHGQIVSTFDGIPVNPEPAFEAKQNEAVQNLERNANLELRSLEQRQKDGQPIDNATDSKALKRKLTTQRPAEQNNLAQITGALPEQTNDHASLYSASPRVSPTRSVPAQLLREQSSMGAHWQNPDQTVGQSNIIANRPGRSAHKKLTKLMRNDEGEAPTGLSKMRDPLENLSLPRKPETQKLQTKEKLGDRSLKSGNSHIQGQEQPNHHGKQQERTSKSAKGIKNATGNVDKSEMPVSPPQPRKYKPSRKDAPKASHAQRKSKKKESQIEDSNVSPVQLPVNRSPGSTRCTQARNQPTPGSGAMAHGVGQKKQPKAKAGGVEAVNWDEDLEADEDSKNTLHQERKKGAKTKSMSVKKGRRTETAKANRTKQRAAKVKASPAPLNRQKTRRAAALTANKKIQGIAKSDESEEEQPDPQSSKRNAKLSPNFEGEPSSISPTWHGNRGEVDCKIAPPNTPSTSSKDHDNRIYSAPDQQRKEIFLLPPQADPTTSPSDEIFLVNSSERTGRAANAEHDMSHQHNTSAINTVSENGAPSSGNRIGKDLDDRINPGDVSVLETENSHFQDAMAPSLGNSSRDSRSPIHGDNCSSSAVDDTRRENQASRLSNEYTPKQSSQRTEMMVNVFAPSGDGSWASKLEGALSTVQKLPDGPPPESTRNRERQIKRYKKPDDASKPSISKVSGKAIEFEVSPRATTHNSSPHLSGDQLRGKEPSYNVIEADRINMRNGKDQPRESTRDGSRGDFVPHPSPTEGPTSNALETQLSELIEISSGEEDSSDGNLMENPEITADANINLAPEGARDAQAKTITPLKPDPQLPGAPTDETEDFTAPQPTTGLSSEQRRKREARSIKLTFDTPTMDVSPESLLGIAEPFKHTPDPNRKSNLISFCATGPRNQGVSSCPKPLASGNKEHQVSRVPHAKKHKIHKLGVEDQDQGEALRESTPVETHGMILTDGRPALEVAPSHGKRRAGKLISKLQKPMPLLKRNKMPDFSSSKEIFHVGKNRAQDGDATAESPGVERGEFPPVIPAKPLAPVADMGYNAGEAGRRENEVVAKALNAVSVRLPVAASARRSTKRSLSSYRVIDAGPRANKRHADETAANALNEVALGKRRKLSPKLNIVQKLPPRSILKRSSSIERDVLQITGSQGSRVDENGSPLPFVHSRHVVIGESQPHPTQGIVRLTQTGEPVRGEPERTMRSVDEMKSYDTSTLLHTDSWLPQSKKGPFEAAGNSKLQRSSPNASSSIIDEMELHHVDDTGNFINMETENVIASRTPADPFMETSHRRPNKFMEALRQSAHHDNNVILRGPKIAHGREALRTLTYCEVKNEDEDEDMEITLVGQGSGDERSDTASKKSSNSQSPNSEECSPPEKQSGSRDHDTVEDEWRKALQPHQRQTLEVLYDISHVSSSFS